MRDRSGSPDRVTTSPESPPATTGSPGSRSARVLTMVGLSALLVLALIIVDVLELSQHNPVEAISPHYYMALGNSLSFGYQPNFDFTSGFADDIVNDMRSANLAGPTQKPVTELINYACAGETTASMIDGTCAARFAHRGSYTGAQLQAAINFLKDSRHQGRVSPVTLEIGVNDVFNDFNAATCTESPNADNDLATMDANLTDIILPSLVDALGTPSGAPSGDLHLLNYYNPYASVCPNSYTFVHILNDHLAADAAKFRISVIDVYGAFGGDNMTATHICDYTWYCDPRFHDIHPTDKGYRVIAQAVENALGLPGASPLGINSAPAVALWGIAHEAAFWRGSLARLRRG
ncbi:MAG TPA: SGNH/GDSL hydrolase family protein [Ktedonobacterales bacterium]|nr:SGNH/GDSL hydrolase family protein [Ktedonobacterales bacterium]